MKILVIEDEKKVVSFIKKGLESEGFVVVIALNGKEGLKRSYDESIDLIILDLMLPELDGLSILKEIRKDKISKQILILTAKGEIEDRVTGLNLGADDYLVKPFAFAELLARIRALLRRVDSQKNPIIQFGNLAVNLMTHEVFRGEKRIELTSKEYALLEFLVHNVNHVLNRSTISEHVWHYNFDRGTNFIDVYINRLRNKIDEGYKEQFIQTVRGYGYMFKA